MSPTGAAAHMVHMMQKALLTAVVAALLVGGLSVTGTTPADLINSALMTVTPLLASSELSEL